ncbi:MAG: LacI family DNA-binding transcriptional regulator, partial [Armatimonadota bacterium]
GSIIICDRKIPQKVFDELSSRQHPSVVIAHGVVAGGGNVGSIVIDLRTGVRQVVEHLVSNGHRKIAFIDSDLQDELWGYFREEIARLGISVPPERYICSGREVEDGVAATRALLSVGDPPTAIFARTDILAVGALHEIRKRGLSVPGDISVVGHDDLSFLSIAEPGLSTVHIDYTALAEAAAGALCGLLSRPDGGAPIEKVETRLVVRGTSGRAQD